MWIGYGMKYGVTTLYEASPRGVSTGAIRAGEGAHSSGKKTAVERYVNDGSAHSCLRYVAASDGVTQSGNWPSGSLMVEKTTDEGGHSIETYTDFRGNMVCRKDGGAATYFVYDDYGDLRYILPPGVSGTRKRTDSSMADMAYWYDYDSRGRMTLKKLPGVRASIMVYDPADRLVGERSAHHSSGQWRLYGYDSHGRQAVSADFTMTDAAAATYASECRTSVLQGGGSYAGYTMPGAPSGGKTVSASYYDTYDFITVNSLSSAFNWTSTGAAFSFANPGKVSKGLQTGVYTGKGYESYYYNLDGQLMESYATGFNNVRTNYTYTYRGEPAKRWWTLPDGTVRTLEWQYDTSGRQKGMTVSYNGTDGTTGERLLAYNGAGLVSREDIGKAYRLLTYDVAGRLTQAEVKTQGPPRPPKQDRESLAGESEFSPLALPPSRPVWTVSTELLAYDAAGRISKKTISGRGYSYIYDGRGRLIKANAEGSNDFSAEYGYDDRNNLTSLRRNGAVDKSGTTYSYGTLDNLTYSYTGNRVTGVSASTEALPFEGMTGLGKNGNYTLSYDGSGRLTKDSSRGIVNISYDNDGRVINVKFSDMSEQQYEWDANGNHVVTRFMGVSATGKPNTRKTLIYTGDGRVMEDGVEKYALFPGGYVQNGRYYWYSKDYQGNNITVLNESGTPVQVNDYYPYGEVWLEPEGQPWLYSGNERLREDGINEYDFNARRYNSALGMFTTWDPLAEKRPWDSPYSFCAGDPVNHSDPTGKRYRVDINPENSTIIIRAKYYTLASSEKSAKQAIDFWNNQKFNYKGYTVTFELSVVVVVIDAEIFGKNVDPEMKCLNYYVQLDQDGNANYYRVIKRKKNTVNGTTKGRYQVNVVQRMSKNRETGAHEIGHTLGLDHYEEGIMTENYNDPKRSRMIGNAEVTAIIENSLQSSEEDNTQTGTAWINSSRATSLPIKEKHR